MFNICQLIMANLTASIQMWYVKSPAITRETTWQQSYNPSCIIHDDAIKSSSDNSFTWTNCY